VRGGGEEGRGFIPQTIPGKEKRKDGDFRREKDASSLGGNHPRKGLTMNGGRCGVKGGRGHRHGRRREKTAITGIFRRKKEEGGVTSASEGF